VRHEEDDDRHDVDSPIIARAMPAENFPNAVFVRSMLRIVPAGSAFIRRRCFMPRQLAKTIINAKRTKKAAAKPVPSA
jgi:hypothetical protein